MSKNIIILTAAFAASLITSTAQAAFVPSQTDYFYESQPATGPGWDDAYNSIYFNIYDTIAPPYYYCMLTGAGWTDGKVPVSKDGSANAILGITPDNSSCVLRVPKDVAAGTYEVNLSFSYGGDEQTQTYRFTYIEPEPPFDDGQHATVDAVLTSHGDRKIWKAGEVIRFAFNVSNVTRQIPGGDYIRVEIGAADVVRAGVSESNIDFGFACPSVGAGVPVGGGFACTGAYTVSQADIDAGEIMLAFGAALSTRDFALYGGTLKENFEVEKVPEPETPTEPETPEKTVCKPMPAPANGAKFVFRYPTGSACS